MSDYFNSFANPQGGGGQDIPQPGTPAFYQWLQSIAGQGQPQPGGPPGPLAANPANLPASRNMANMSMVGLPSSSGFTLPNGTPAPVAADASLVRGGVSQGAHAAPPPPQGPQMQAASVKQQQPQQKPPPVKKPAPAQPVSTGPQGAVDAASPTASPAASNMPFPGQIDTQGVWGPRPGAAASPTPAPVAPVVPGAPSNGAVPNLGYYRPTSGDVRGGGWGQPGPTWMQYGANDPRMFQGPLAAQPGAAAAAAAPPPPPAPAAAPAATAAAPGPGPIAPGVGTLWLRKLFGGVPASDLAKMT